MSDAKKPVEEKKAQPIMQHIAVMLANGIRCISCGYEQSNRNLKAGARIPVCIPKRHLQN